MDNHLNKRLQSILKQGKSLIKTIESPSELREIKSKILGKKSAVQEIFNLMLLEKNLETKKLIGKEINAIKTQLEALLKNKSLDIEIKNHEKIAHQKMDLTLKSIYHTSPGKIHPISQSIQRIYSIFHSLGFQLIEGPEIEKEYYNFEALNIPKYHSSREDHDSFYIAFKDSMLLRTQVSSVQIRALEVLKNPFAIISLGRCFRKDNSDSTHFHTFHQLEAMVVDENLSLANLKGTLDLFCSLFFFRKIKSQFKKDFFPFTRPSAEYSIECFLCNPNNQTYDSQFSKEVCKICKNTGWLEIAGAGIIHKNILDTAQINTKKYSGYAFGMGIERLVMLQHQIPDIRILYENNLNFLEQF